ncbi:geranylgeranyl pyrophosphate synthetase [Jimgerdemannia flammicorona]|uniref:Geranylgeranyl pyrophosphate synthetase n=1 Tax=Jimgerdemannia flammicorona TaxID=994334 RepID=A0A433QJK6_9FUNG|nr:geranylgeranyl pyrophosphate synthetase [Jimgerdemannia flammicorona]
MMLIPSVISRVRAHRNRMSKPDPKQQGQDGTANKSKTDGQQSPPLGKLSRTNSQEHGQSDVASSNETVDEKTAQSLHSVEHGMSPDLRHAHEAVKIKTNSQQRFPKNYYSITPPSTPTKSIVTPPLESYFASHFSDMAYVNINPNPAKAALYPNNKNYAVSLQAINHASNEVVVPKNNDEILLEPYTYLTANPGKEIRSKMIDAFDEWINVPKEELAVITKVVEMLHTASLLIDDVEDDSELRRGIPVAHQIYGIPQTINCANYVYFLALSEINKLNNPKLVTIYTVLPFHMPTFVVSSRDVSTTVFKFHPTHPTHPFTEELLNLHRGQGMELFWRDTLTCPTEEEFIDMVNNKTCGLLRLAVKLMAEASGTSVDYVPLVNLIGIHFQVRDDYMNLQSSTYADHKGFCEDLSEGKFSFPIIHCIRADTTNRQMLNILKQRPQSIELKKFALQVMERTQSFEYTRRYLAEVEIRAREEITRLGGNKHLERIMDVLAVKV